MKTYSKIVNYLAHLLSGILAVLFLTYGILMLWDIFRTEINAFASYDLLQYRPNIEDNEPPYLDDLIKINPDTKAWITIYNTHINYPVMKGDDDNEYLNKDVYGEFSISGSIFMASQGDETFQSSYNVIYGHNMANGSMFGDIVKFSDKEYFDNHSTGILILENEAYDMRVVGYLETDAYDINIYYPTKTDSELSDFIAYVQSNAKYSRDITTSKLISLSTCSSIGTDRRDVLICEVSDTPRSIPIREETKPIQRKAIGHPMAGAYWALMNLVILIATIYSALRFVYYKKNALFRFIEIGACVISLSLFVITENLQKPIQIVDAWTLLMLIILIGVWLIAKKYDKKE